MEAVTEYISNLFLSSGLVIAVGAYVIGSIIKTVSVIPNKYIPLIGGVLGALAGGLVPVLFPDTHWFIASVNGLALGWAATGLDQTVKKITGKEG